jgi:RNA polymerase sigma factor (sigma-70 family)
MGVKLEMGLNVTFPHKASIALRKTVDTSDNALMSAVTAGTVSKLAILFERHHRSLYRYFMSMTRDPRTSEDLVQDVFFRILRFRATYDPRQSFTAWMYQIARNANVDRIRQKRGETIEFDELAMRNQEPASPDPDPEASAVRTQDLERVRQAMELLPPEKREILVFCRFQGMKYEEIAEVLGCGVGTVKVRVYRAMRALAEIYSTLAGEKAYDLR